jgi:hypothetical protein
VRDRGGPPPTRISSVDLRPPTPVAR